MRVDAGMTACLAQTYDRPPVWCVDTDDPPLCRPHLEHAGRDVALLVHDYRDLEQLLPKPVTVFPDEHHVYQSRTGPPAEASVPLRLDVEALQAEIWWLAAAWAEVLADRHRLADPPVHVRAGHAVQWAVQLITPRVEVLARIPEVQMVSYPAADPTQAIRHRTVELCYVTGAQGVLDLMAVHRRARSVLGLTDPLYALPGRCQVRGCGAAELRVRGGSDTVWCGRCGAIMTRDDYDRLGNVFLREAA